MLACAVLLSLLLPGAACCPGIPDLPEPKAELPLAALGNLPSSAADVVLSWPIASTPVLNSPFGPRQLGSEGARFDWHRGVDLKLPVGTPLLAPAEAVVVHAGTHPGYADTIVQLRHNSSPPYLYTLYLHLQSVPVTAGDMVQPGEPFALSGQRSATYPHLHWEARLGCLRQECCENPLGRMAGAGDAPAPAVLEAVGADPHLGGLVLLSATVPGDEIDFHAIGLQWGSASHLFDLDSLNALSPTGQGSLLDDPLYFREAEDLPVAFLPSRYNSTYPSADYEVLFLGLDPSVSSGAATVQDAAGAPVVSAVQATRPPLQVRASRSVAIATPGSLVAVAFRVANVGVQPLGVTFSARSAQSLPLQLSRAGAVLAPGAEVAVTLEAQLDDDLPEGVGDILLFRAAVQGGGFTDVLVDTIEGWEPPTSLLVY